MARTNQTRYGITVGDDDGCFESALESVNTWGGVLEHPAQSHAWPAFGLVKPVRGSWQPSGEGWVTEVSQVAYGHRARKRTWLYYCGDREPFDLNWSEPPATHQVSKDRRAVQKPVLSKLEASLTPIAFAETLVALARWSRA